MHLQSYSFALLLIFFSFSIAVTAAKNLDANV